MPTPAPSIPVIERYVAGRDPEVRSGEDLRAWVAEQRELDDRGEFFFACVQFAFTATRPARLSFGLTRRGRCPRRRGSARARGSGIVRRAPRRRGRRARASASRSPSARRPGAGRAAHSYVRLDRPSLLDAHEALEQVVETGGRVVLDVRGAHHVLGAVDPEAAEVAVVLGARVVEVGEVAAVVDDALGVRVREPDAGQRRVLERRPAVGDPAELRRRPPQSPSGPPCERGERLVDVEQLRPDVRDAESLEPGRVLLEVGQSATRRPRTGRSRRRSPPPRSRSRSSSGGRASGR